MNEPAHLDCVLELQALQGEVRAAKAQLLRLAAAGPAKEALAQPGVRAWVQSEAYAAALATARQARDAVRRDAIAQLQLVEEVNRLEAGARKIEREGARMEGLVALLTHSLGQVMAEWQQQYPTNQDFVRNTLPGCYAHVIEWAGRCQDRLSRCVAELMRVPREVLPAAAEQGRLHGGAGAADPAARGRRGSGFSLPPASSLALVDRMALALPYVAAPRAAAQLRAAASAGPSPAAASTALTGGLGGSLGSLVLRGSGASGGTGGGVGDAGLLGAGSGGLGSSTGFGLGASGGGWPGMGMGSTSGAGGGFGGFGSAHGGLHSGGMPGVGPGLSSVGAGAAAAAAAQAGMSWSPGAAALGLPTLCYWLAMAAAAEPLAPLRCPSSLLHDLMARFEGHEQTAMWLAQADAKLRARFRDLAALRPVCAALRERLGAKRAADGAERVAVLARSRRDIGELVAAIAPNVERALRELEEQGAVRLAPWKKVNGRSAGEYLDEMRSLFARIEQLQAQHAQLQGHAAQHAQHTQQLGFGPPQPSTVGVSRLGF
ncbi:hypothetical protein HYH03_001112 [Edaphochlamys debaryana]|uniref:Uncharacterized protein n=1 Tax=Edaphochlamys debaryana TaxID=47281 RepID=A0A835YEQ0_9CHLO|nr:hypothetical protein HYH03_001112 [Edaphochlamys debaryana]|eukprot:KAG2501318.1 hypothetical protein HYH03_001112 [Edaphochlamys debaryana]